MNSPALVFGVDFDPACKCAIIQVCGGLPRRLEVELQAEIWRGDMEFDIVGAVCGLEENLKYIPEFPHSLIRFCGLGEDVPVGQVGADEEAGRRPSHTDFGRKKIRFGGLQPSLLHENGSGKGGEVEALSEMRSCAGNAGAEDGDGLVQGDFEGALFSRMVSLR